tara:strand:+ start:2632 stop:3792 length:1161 start_codon:yes stop_codon:yes gene_type:complete
MIKKHIFKMFLVFMVSYPAVGQDDFEKWLKNQEADLTEISEGEVKALAAITKEFETYSEEQDRLYNAFKKSVEEKWDSFRFSSQKEFVDYDEDLNARGSIDFEKGEVEIEVLIEKKDGVSKKEMDDVAKQKIQNKIEKIVTKPAYDNKPILDNQLKNKKGLKVTKANAKNFSKEVVNAKRATKKEIKSKDKKKRVKYTVKFKLIPDHLKTRSERYKNEVLSQARRHGLPPNLVFAIIQTESDFNPKARSHIPAYGLMQLVPKSGGRDAYRYLYKKDKFLRGRYLYNPKNNIELGCAYLGKLKNVYFKGINNEESIYHCVISAYNTGPGNVAKAMTGTTKLKPTISIVNKMSSKKVYNQLVQKLPYKETRNYLKKVTQRMPYYANYN